MVGLDPLLPLEGDDPLTEPQKNLLTWLGQEDYSQYGECHGASLDMLVSLGLAQVHGPGEHQSGFIARGDGQMYRAVSLTEKGREHLRALAGREEPACEYCGAESGQPCQSEWSDCLKNK